MSLDEIIRFSVYTKISPLWGKDEVSKKYFLEGLVGNTWSSLTYGENRLDFENLDAIAKKIVDISPEDNRYTRVIFSKEALDLQEGKKEGIDLNDSKPYLIDTLDLNEKVYLLQKLNYFFQLNANQSGSYY